MKSEADVRNKEGGPFRNANLIIHQGVANIFHQTVKIPCILGVAEEFHEILSGRYRAHSLANLLQFPDGRARQFSSGSWRVGLTVSALSLSPPRRYRSERWDDRGIRKAIQSETPTIL